MYFFLLNFNGMKTKRLESTILMVIPYILKEKHCNKYIHTKLDTCHM